MDKLIPSYMDLGVRMANYDQTNVTVIESEAEVRAKVNEVVEKKLDKDGNFQGSWFGIPRPEYAEPGIQGQVTKNREDIEVIEPKVSELETDNINNKNKINELDIFKNFSKVHVTDFGAVGDGITDSTNAINQCWDYCYANGKTMYFPNGNYIYNDVIKPTNPNTPVSIEGESSNGVIINNLINNHNFVIDFSACKSVNFVNMCTTENKFRVYNTVPNGSMKEWMFINRDRNVRVLNVYSLSKDAGGTSWKDFTITEKPTTYVRDFIDSRYATCPLELWNNSGYNTININNVTLNDDGTVANPSDNSAIGITDYSNGVAGVVYIDMLGERRFFKLARKDSLYKSGVNNDGIVMDISPDGHIAIGSSFLNNDPVATGVATIKMRDKYPSIKWYDADQQNMMSNITSINGEFRMYHNNRELIFFDSEGNIIKIPKIANKLILNESSASRGLVMTYGEKQHTMYVDSKGDVRIATTNLNVSPVDGQGWVIGGSRRTGATSQRPTGLSNSSDIGFQYYDQTLKKPIWWSGTDWRDANGSVV